MKQRIILAMALIGLSTAAEARRAYMQNFNTTYSEKGAPMEELGKFSCGACHVRATGGGARNAYGVDFRNAGRSFADIELVDSDGDGINNIDEILAGTNPGDEESN